jgi:hypothetical protein
MPSTGGSLAGLFGGAGSIAVREACSILDGMLATLGTSHSFVSDDQPGTSVTSEVRGGRDPVKR